MKKTTFTLCLLLAFILSHPVIAQQERDSLKQVEYRDSVLMEKISSLPNILEIEKLPSSSYYKAKYKIYFKQPLNHDDTTLGFFKQRLFLLHKDFDKPMVFTTEGYAAEYGNIAFYQNELNSIVDGNEILVEHRYFSESTPENAGWQYLTVENAAADHHNIIQAFKKLYTDKWISTGISKGGQTTLYLVTLYPEDVDFAVAYVAPLNYGVEDGRHESFIDKNGTRKERKAIRAFQLELLERKDSLIPMFEKHINEKDYTFRIPIKEVYDFCVLEYSFAFWQWVADTEGIPGEDAGKQAIFDHLISVAGPEYFSIESGEGFLPFFYQAANELGYYGYDMEPFRDYMDITDTDDYLSEIFLPDSISDIEFNYRTNSLVFDYLEEGKPKIIAIYGEHDPWTASGVDVKRKGMIYKFVKENGHHATRISNMPEKQKEKILEVIEEWMEE
ncbi:MAG: aminopeptidase [Bacteroidales bacterium]|nr:aminopeptidase [Bacteroidales bacterium]MCF8344900.1 aminopeptidase [Bacteroidales bacterium]MCF8350000.1 aminopeptidase [Bacteroidales bacterium]MCF8376371.1 aminopeptidase [Bacteroidales bacterium]MCF8400537.1 aminopeptidase [Bacteroidales bacterium]